MLVKVTEEHIKNGKKKDCHCCPVALAIREANGSGYVSVGLSYAYVGLGPITYKLPKEVTNFINLFDNDEVDTFEPFEFELEES